MRITLIIKWFIFNIFQRQATKKQSFSRILYFPAKIHSIFTATLLLFKASLNMKKKYLPILFVITLAALLLIQKDIVMPFAEWVAASDLFLEQSGDKGSRMATSTTMTNHAFNQCNTEVRDTIDSDIKITFPNEALQSWTLGNYRYLINADIELTKSTGESFFKKYACQIQYTEESDLDDVMNPDNWDISGISGLTGL